METFLRTKYNALRDVIEIRRLREGSVRVTHRTPKLIGDAGFPFLRGAWDRSTHRGAGPAV